MFAMLNVIRLASVLTLIFAAAASTAAPDMQNPSKAVSGIVTDESGNPVGGVVVIAPGTTAGTITGNDGSFSLNLPGEADILQFSFLGMQTQNVTVGSQVKFNVTMISDAIGINEVVVVGYGSMTKKDIATAIGSVGGEELTERASAFNMMQAISGKVAGVQNVSFSGKPGGASALRIRGMGSINAGNDPIYVLDGVVGVNPDIINTSNIESINVLKDAAAAAMYGAQGGNGVVIITTKKGQKGAGAVTYDMRLGVGMLNRKMDLLNSDEFMQVQERAYAYSGKTMPHLTTPMENLFYYDKNADNSYKYDSRGLLIASPKYNTDWQKELTQKAFTNDHILSFSGANDRSSIYASVGYQDYQGLVKETYSKRYSGTVNASTKIKDWLVVKAMATAGSQNYNEMDGGFGQGPVRNMIEMPPIVPVQYEDGTYGRKSDYPLGESAENPLVVLQKVKNLTEYDFAIFDLNATVNLCKQLQFTAIGDYQLNNSKNKRYAQAGVLDYSENNGGYADLSNTNRKRIASENYFTYTDDFFNDQLSSVFVLGASWYYNYMESFSAGSENFFDDSFGYNNLGAGTVYHKPGSNAEKITMNSFYFRMNHSFRDKYMLGFTFRADGASNFGENNKYGYFPSASAAWRLSEESFFEPAKKVVNEMKLRVSYGAVGNAMIPSYRTLPSYNNSSMILNKQLQPYVVLGNMGNPDLRWEASYQFNVGLDIGLFRNRLELILDLYDRTTKDLLFEKNIPYTTGYSTTWTNLGKIRNKGLEVTVSSRNIANRNFMWTTDIVFSANKIVVVDVGGQTIDTGNDTIAREGEEWASYNFYNRLGTWGLDEVDEAAKYGKKPGDIKFEDRDHNYIIDDKDRRIMGNGVPKGNITMVNTFTYRGFSLMFDLNYVYGFKILGVTPTMMENRQLYGNSLSSVLDAWMPESQNSMIAALRLPSDVNFGENEKDSRMLYKGDYLRIRNVSLSYSFSPELLRKLKVVQGLSLGVSVENLHVFTKYPGFDPEVGAFNTDTGQSVDFYSYPRPTTISANLKIVF